MIQFTELELTNFAIYPRAQFAFSVDPKRPLTVIRGENESGKTTLMRAFLWALFGGEALQGAQVAKFLRPAWVPNNEAIATKVKLSFRKTNKDGLSVSFNLVRSLTTVDASSAHVAGEHVTLARQEPDGSFRPLTEAALDTLHAIIRPEMKDFYFMDGEKAMDFVGGAEGNHSDQLMRRMIGKSIRALLSLDELRRAAERVDKQKNEYFKEIAAATKGSAGVNLSLELKRVEAAIDGLKGELPKIKVLFEAAAETHRQADEKFSDRIEKMESSNKKAGELKRHRDDRDRLILQRQQLLHQLADRTPGADLAAAMIGKSLKEIIDRLEPMKETGHIPPADLQVIPRLLKRAKCLCGTKLVDGSTEVLELGRLLEAARKVESGARFLDAVLAAANFHTRAGSAAIRSDAVSVARKELADLDPRVSALCVAIKLLEEAISEESGDAGTVGEFRKDVQAKLALRDALQEKFSRLSVDLEKLENERRSIQEQVRLAGSRNSQVCALRASARAADLVHAVLKSAYEHVERDQVADVSKSMTGLFSEMVGKGDDALFSDVGLRSISQKTGLPEYELFARFREGDKPLSMINGASRRALSVAFVLALAEQTGSRVPLVSDSLLHSTSGAVRSRLVEFISTGDRVGQPIMFGTRADFSAPEVRSVLAKYGGVTYTLTAQSHVGKDVLTADPQRAQSNQVSVCKCGPASFCRVCERVGDVTAVDLCSTYQ